MYPLEVNKIILYTSVWAVVNFLNYFWIWVLQGTMTKAAFEEHKKNSFLGVEE